MTTETEELLKIITEAKGLAASSLITAGARDIVTKVADLAMTLINNDINTQQNEAEAAVCLQGITESFRESSKEEVLEHLNKVVIAISTIVRAAMKLEKAQEQSEKMFHDEKTTEDEMQAQENEEADLVDVLVEEIKLFHNSAPEEVGNESLNSDDSLEKE